ncbi:MAG: hypothetical protein JO321_02730 [Solirubrobacterales bacterium]|nr:hypothetical protein [Solirubrobacterales bacterium]MBV9534306.1 hypothetical protein [Solirubrobacterales bacterium]
MRGDRELRLRRDLTRRKIVDFLTTEYARSANGDRVPALQIELLIAAGFQLISGAICNGGTNALPQKLAELDGFLIPAHG